MKLPKTCPRRLLYLSAIVAICSLGLLCSNARIAFYKAYKKAEKNYLSTHLKQDTQAARQFFYSEYRVNTDYIENHSDSIGAKATFINVCKTSCALLRGYNETQKLCNDITTYNQFDKYRVYFCNVKVSLENDQPLTCEAINWNTFKASCDSRIAKI